MSAGGGSRQLVLVQENVNTREAHAARKRQAFASQFVDIAWSKNEKITNERWHPDAKPPSSFPAYLPRLILLLLLAGLGNLCKCIQAA